MVIWRNAVQPMTGFNFPPDCGPCSGPASLITSPPPVIPNYSAPVLGLLCLLPGPVHHPQPEGNGCPHTARGPQSPGPGFSATDLSPSTHSDPRSSCCSLGALRGPALWDPDRAIPSGSPGSPCSSKPSESSGAGRV